MAYIKGGGSVASLPTRLVGSHRRPHATSVAQVAVTAQLLRAKRRHRVHNRIYKSDRRPSIVSIGSVWPGYSPIHGMPRLALYLLSQMVSL